MTIRSNIDARYLNTRLGYIERCAETAPTGAFDEALVIVEALSETFASLRAKLLEAGIKLPNDDHYREVEAVMYGAIRDHNPLMFDAAEGFGEHIDGPAGVRMYERLKEDLASINSINVGA